ncbi:hypothetical protein [Companilactobacillus allii]|nr:hypothetical protein [Companilactobacillus allii]
MNIPLDIFVRYEAGDKRIPEDRYQKVIDDLSNLRDDSGSVLN